MPINKIKYDKRITGGIYVEDFRWRGIWYVNGRVKTASFTISQYGEELAYKLAAKSAELGRKVHQHEITDSIENKERKGINKTYRTFGNTTYFFWAAEWNENSIRTTAHYSIHRYGEDTAYKMAVLSRYLKRRVTTNDIEKISLLQPIDALFY